MNFEITNPDKIIYPKEKITKKDVVLYYSRLAKYMLPFLKDRPISVIRCLSGINGECFFKKHPKTERKHIKTFFMGGDTENDEYFYLTKEEDIVFQAQMGTIEFHIWANKVNKLNSPDIMTFDLDPDEKLPLETLRDGAKKLKSVLDELKLKSYLKTSGGKGYHVLVPFKKSLSYQKFSEFSRRVAELMESLYPNLFTSNIRKATRKNKIFLDWQRNTKGATCVAPYSLRARSGAKVSMPIAWKNIDKIAPNEIDIFSGVKGKNVWQDFFNLSQKLSN